MIDFKELPATVKQGDPDAFEKFCAEFLEIMGFTIVGGPSRGADGGIDLKVRDFRTSTNGFVLTETYWLASCKHFAHSGKSVGVDDELNISDRLKQHGCIGFLGLYTTIVSTSLENRLKDLTPYAIFNNRKIEREIVGFYSKEVLFARYFPNSYKRWKETYNFLEPVKLFEAFGLATKKRTKD